MTGWFLFEDANISNLLCACVSTYLAFLQMGKVATSEWTHPSTTPQQVTN